MKLARSILYITILLLFVHMSCAIDLKNPIKVDLPVEITFPTKIGGEVGTATESFKKTANEWGPIVVPGFENFKGIKEIIDTGELPTITRDNEDKIMRSYENDCWKPLWGKQVGTLEYSEFAAAIVADVFGGSGGVTSAFLYAELKEQVDVLSDQLENESEIVIDKFQDVLAQALANAIMTKKVQAFQMGGIEVEAGVATYKKDYINNHRPYIRYRFINKGYAHPIFIKNNCDRPIKLAIRYKTMLGNWTNEGWWNFEPHEQNFLLLNKEQVQTDSRIFYFYAETMDGIYKWSGNETLKLKNGESLRMKKSNFKIGSCGNIFELGINCEDECVTSVSEISLASTMTVLNDGTYIFSTEDKAPPFLYRSLFVDRTLSGNAEFGVAVEGVHSTWLLTNQGDSLVTLQDIDQNKFKNWYLDVNEITGNAFVTPEITDGAFWLLSRDGNGLTFQNMGDSKFKSYYLDNSGGVSHDKSSDTIFIASPTLSS